jgi:hypothetical protein
MFVGDARSLERLARDKHSSLLRKSFIRFAPKKGQAFFELFHARQKKGFRLRLEVFTEIAKNHISNTKVILDIAISIPPVTLSLLISYQSFNLKP